MALYRENILTLIGSRRYHSCILTTYSFDFYFFEMKAMKWLRSSGVRNINILIDGHYYSELMKQSTGEEMKLTPGYSLYPVFSDSIFHPKIWMLFGEKEGLLIIGSGNLTNSGNGNNDEIWGAFHFDIRQIDNSLVFSTAWKYISGICNSVKGLMNEKTTRWILEYSKWLSELPKPKDFQFVNTSQKEKIALLYNSESSSIWKQLSKILTNENIVEITTISPYYDNNGKALIELKSLFPKSLINVIIDENGLIPSLLLSNKVFSFYDWYESGVSKTLHSKTSDINNNTKLHAKIIHFRTKSKKEFCLFGSANITPEGLGLPGARHINSELSLLLQSESGGILNQLGIKLKANNRKKLSDFKQTNIPSIFDTVIRNNQYKIKLLSAELFYEELTLFSDGNYTNPLKLSLFDRQNKFIDSIDILDFKPEIKLKINQSFLSTQYVQLCDKSNDEAISNKILVSDYFLLSKTHPNPKTEDIERIYSEIQSGELGRILDLMHYAILDETEKEDDPNILKKRKTNETDKDEKQKPGILYDLSSYKTINSSSFEKNLLFSSVPLRVLDMLRLINFNEISPVTQDDIRIDEQEEDITNISGNDDSELKAAPDFDYSLLVSEYNKLGKYFDVLYYFQFDKLYNKNRTTPYKPTLSDITKYLIAIELMLEYGGKTIKYFDDNKPSFFNYLPFYDENYDTGSVKGCSLSLTGYFLMMCRAGFKEYEFDYTKNKLEQLKNEALVGTIVCLLNNKWKENEWYYLDTMLLNTLHYLGWKDIDVYDNNIINTIESVKQRISLLKNKVYGLNDNLNRFITIVCPKLRDVLYKRSIMDFDDVAHKGQLIYSSLVGYCYVKSVTQSNEFTLIRPGFIWDERLKDYMRHRPDEIYTPLKLPSFICIDL